MRTGSHRTWPLPSFERATAAVRGCGAGSAKLSLRTKFASRLDATRLQGREAVRSGVRGARTIRCQMMTPELAKEGGMGNGRARCTTTPAGSAVQQP